MRDQGLGDSSPFVVLAPSKADEEALGGFWRESPPERHDVPVQAGKCRSPGPVGGVTQRLETAGTMETFPIIST